jgi:hypothetical protein
MSGSCPPFGRRVLLRLGFLSCTFSLIFGCSPEGAGTGEAPKESGGQSRLKRMEDLTSKAKTRSKTAKK